MVALFDIAKKAANMESAVLDLIEEADPGLMQEFDWIGAAVAGWYERDEYHHPAVQSLMRTLRERADDILERVEYDIYDTWWWPEREPKPSSTK